MKFSEFLIAAVQQSEIPLRFEPGAEESVARPVTEYLKAWLQSHEPPAIETSFDQGRMLLIQELLEELADERPLPE